ncbi:MAG: hypothetical protein V1685_03235 [Parcubacteria group bacterium]
MPTKTHLVIQAINALQHRSPWRTSDKFPANGSTADKVRWILDSTREHTILAINIPVAVWLWQVMGQEDPLASDIAALFDDPAMAESAIIAECTRHEYRTISRVLGVRLTLSDQIQKRIDHTPTYLRAVLRKMKERIPRGDTRERIEQRVLTCFRENRELMVRLPKLHCIYAGVIIWLFFRLSRTAPTSDEVIKLILKVLYKEYRDPEVERGVIDQAAADAALMDARMTLTELYASGCISGVLDDRIVVCESIRP